MRVFLFFVLLASAVLCKNQLCEQAIAFSPSIYRVSLCYLSNTVNIAMTAKQSPKQSPKPSLPILRVDISGSIVSHGGFINKPLIFSRRVVTGISKSLVQLKQCLEEKNFECDFVIKNDFVGKRGKSDFSVKKVSHITVVLAEKWVEGGDEFSFESINVIYTTINNNNNNNNSNNKRVRRSCDDATPQEICLVGGTVPDVKHNDDESGGKKTPKITTKIVIKRKIGSTSSKSASLNTTTIIPPSSDHNRLKKNIRRISIQSNVKFHHLDSINERRSRRRVKKISTGKNEQQREVVASQLCFVVLKALTKLKSSHLLN